MDILIYWFVGATLAGWGIYDLLSGRRAQNSRQVRHGVISSVLGILLLIGAYLS